MDLSNFFADPRVTFLNFGDRIVVVALICLAVFLLRRKNPILKDIGVCVGVAVVLLMYLPLGIVCVVVLLAYDRIERYFTRLATKPGYLAGAILFGILIGITIHVVPILLQARR